MPRKERSSVSLKIRSLAGLLLFFLFSEIIPSQKGEIIPLSRKVGTTVDAEEREILGLFPDIDGFESAQFFMLSDDRYFAKIVYLDHTRPRTMKRHYTWRQLHRLKYRAGSHPEITEEMRAEHRYKLSYLSVHEMLERIPPSTFCTIRHTSGRRITGTFVDYRDRTIYFQSPTRRIQFPVTQIESISYRPFVDDGNVVKKVVSFLLGAGMGYAVGELWNLQSRPAADVAWNNRFTGLILGLVSGGQMFEAVSIITSPKKFIAFTPEEVAKMK